MKLHQLREILKSDGKYKQYAVVYDTEQHFDIESGCAIDIILDKYAYTEIKHIEAFEDQLILYI